MTIEERDEIVERFRVMKRQAEKALAQVKDDELFVQLDEESNSLALIMKHIAGNMRSRWTDFLTTDGEKPDRHRDGEFEIHQNDDKAELFRQWEHGWKCLFAAIEPLSLEDMQRTVTIRREPHTVHKAILLQVAHYALHIGQIIFLAKHLRAKEWKTLSIARGKSDDWLRNAK